MATYLVKRKDGGVTILNTVDGVSPEACIAKWHSSRQAEVVSYREAGQAGIPDDRTFRNAWCDVTDEPVVDIDMAKARDIQRDRLRELRKPRLAALDIEMSRAYNRSPAIRDVIEAKRQALRDVTQDPMIDAALTAGELKDAIPDILKG